MARAGLTPEAVTTHGLAVLDAQGLTGLTLRAVADRAGVAPPSLYKHVSGLDELRALMTVRVLGEATEQIGSAVMGRAGDDALRALLDAYRAWATAHPHRHALVEAPPAPGGPRRPELEAAAGRLLDLFYATLRGYALTDEQLVHAVRALRAAVVGFVSLEHGTGYQLPTDLDASFTFLTDLLASGLARLTTAHPS